MDIFDRPDLDNLLKTQAGPCVSIFLPTERAGREVQQNPIRLKNLLKEAEHRLKDLGVRGVESITKPAHDLVTDAVADLQLQRSDVEATRAIHRCIPRTYRSAPGRSEIRLVLPVQLTR